MASGKNQPATARPAEADPAEDPALIEDARGYIRIEMEAVERLSETLDAQFLRAVSLLRRCSGHVITTGMGKAGMIARKAAATFASTGAPALFVHPAESLHGDLGMITGQDVILSFSYRGQTEEVLRMVPYLKNAGTPIIAVTSNADSELASHADVVLLLRIEREACPLNLAPTASTTAMLVLADTLALTLLKSRGFSAEDYAVYHPGGSLGRRLLTRVGDLMHHGEDNPVIGEHAALSEAVQKMTDTGMASTSIVDGRGRLAGFFTDGDLRRCLLQGRADPAAPVSDLMTRNPKCARPEMMAVKALEILRRHKIIGLPVVNEAHEPIGLIHLHDITRAGII